MIKIVKTGINFDKEPLRAPFGFKGKYLTEIWQAAVYIESSNNKYGLGIGVHNPLWSDSDIFSEYDETGSNKLMLLITKHALKIIEGKTIESPVELLDEIFPEVLKYGKSITKNDNLKETFILNALVPVDNAVWQLYSRENGFECFDDMIPEEYQSAMPFRHEKIANVPLISYGIQINEIKDYINEGSFFLKIKIGNDPDKDNDKKKMLNWDKNRLEEIHKVVKDIKTPYSKTGLIPYYLDANGRYDCKERLLELLSHADKIGALERIILLEEPFDEEYREDVSDIPVRLAADESAHTDKYAVERINLGYKAIALKPIAKTLSMTLKVLKAVNESNIPCFCADLTVNPLLVDWNKNVASRIKTLPGMKIGVLESNGHQNYRNWEKMKGYHPMNGASWINTKNGIYELNDEFYEKSGGILKDSDYYFSLCKKNSALK